MDGRLDWVWMEQYMQQQMDKAEVLCGMADVADDLRMLMESMIDEF